MHSAARRTAQGAVPRTAGAFAFTGTSETLGVNSCLGTTSMEGTHTKKKKTRKNQGSSRASRHPQDWQGHPRTSISHFPRSATSTTPTSRGMIENGFSFYDVMTLQLQTPGPPQEHQPPNFRSCMVLRYFFSDECGSGCCHRPIWVHPTTPIHAGCASADSTRTPHSESQETAIRIPVGRENAALIVRT